MEHVLTPPHKSLLSDQWTKLPHDELIYYGTLYREELKLNKDTNFLEVHKFKILECFGIVKEDEKDWDLSFSSENNLLKIENKKGEIRFESGTCTTNDFIIDYVDDIIDQVVETEINTQPNPDFNQLPPPPSTPLYRENEHQYWPLVCMYSQEQIAKWVESGEIDELLKQFKD